MPKCQKSCNDVLSAAARKAYILYIGEVGSAAASQEHEEKGVDVMIKTQHILGAVLTMLTMVSHAAEEISFDRPGTGFGVATAPVGQWLWEQSLPSASYDESMQEGSKIRHTQLQSDMLLRTGLTNDLELQLSWDGVIWQQQRSNGQTTERHGLGDVGLALKKRIDLDDERLQWALMAQAKLKTGEADFRAAHDVYGLGSVLDYQMKPDLSLSMYTLYEVEDTGQLAATIAPTLNYSLQGPWSGFSEYVFRKQEGQRNEHSLNTGVIYRYGPRLQLDASIGFGLGGDTADYMAGVGFATAF